MEAWMKCLGETCSPNWIKGLNVWVAASVPVAYGTTFPSNTNWFCRTQLLCVYCSTSCLQACCECMDILLVGPLYIHDPMLRCLLCELSWASALIVLFSLKSFVFSLWSCDLHSKHGEPVKLGINVTVAVTSVTDKVKQLNLSPVCLNASNMASFPVGCCAFLQASLHYSSEQQII